MGPRAKFKPWPGTPPRGRPRWTLHNCGQRPWPQQEGRPGGVQVGHLGARARGAAGHSVSWPGEGGGRRFLRYPQLSSQTYLCLLGLFPPFKGFWRVRAAIFKLQVPRAQVGLEWGTSSPRPAGQGSCGLQWLCSRGREEGSGPGEEKIGKWAVVGSRLWPGPRTLLPP